MTTAPRLRAPRLRAILLLLAPLALATAGGMLVGWFHPKRPPPVEVAVPAPAPPPPPAPAAPPPLPEVELKEVPVHVVPSEPGGGGGHPLDLSHPEESAHAGESAEVANGAARVPAPAPPRDFAGPGRVTGAAALMVGSQPVQLYGISPPAQGASCGGTACRAAAEAALGQRLAAGPLSCHTPRPHPGSVVAFAICQDGQGADLGAYLVGQGLATADTGQSYDYVAAESQARGQRRGLWQSR